MADTDTDKAIQTNLKKSHFQLNFFHKIGFASDLFHKIFWFFTFLLDSYSQVSVKLTDYLINFMEFCKAYGRKFDQFQEMSDQKTF